MSQARQSPHDFYARWRTKLTPHIGLLVSGSTFVLIAWRVLAAAHYNPLTATGIVQAGGAANVALASAISSAPIIAGPVLGVAVARLEAKVRAGDVRDWWWFALVIGSIPFLLLLPWTFVLAAWLVLGFAAVVRQVSKRRGRPADRTGVEPSGIPTEAFATVLAIVAVLALSTAPWLPSERITVDKSKIFTGFTVGTDGDDVVILDRDTGLLNRYPSDTVERSICADPSAWYFRTALQEAQRDEYPTCPDSSPVAEARASTRLGGAAFEVMPLLANK